jgi:hypothetical protein
MIGYRLLLCWAISVPGDLALLVIHVIANTIPTLSSALQPSAQGPLPNPSQPQEYPICNPFPPLHIFPPFEVSRVDFPSCRLSLGTTSHFHRISLRLKTFVRLNEVISL